MQTMKGVLLLILAAIAAGFGLNLVRPHPLPLRYEKPGGMRPTKEGVPAVEPSAITLQELRDAPKDSVIFIDARTPLFFKLGHIPQAIILSRKDFSRDFARVQGTLRNRTGRRLVVYCSDDGCDDAIGVARELIRAGLKQVHVFKGGWKEWRDAALPEEHG